MISQEIKETGTQFILNGDYFKTINGDPYILKNTKWVKYNFIFTHEDMIQCQYL